MIKPQASWGIPLSLVAAVSLVISLVITVAPWGTTARPYVLESMTSKQSWAYHCPPQFTGGNTIAYLSDGKGTGGSFIMSIANHPFKLSVPKEIPSWYKKDCLATNP